MAEEKESDNNLGLAQPNKLPPMKIEEVQERAKKIFELRGKAPYSRSQFADCNISDEEVAVISEFVYYWQSLFVEKEKKDAPPS